MVKLISFLNAMLLSTLTSVGCSLENANSERDQYNQEKDACLEIYDSRSYDRKPEPDIFVGREDTIQETTPSDRDIPLDNSAFDDQMLEGEGILIKEMYAENPMEGLTTQETTLELTTPYQFCYYLDKDGNQMPAGTNLLDNWKYFPQNYMGVFSEEGVKRNYCDDSATYGYLCGSNTTWTSGIRKATTSFTVDPCPDGCNVNIGKCNLEQIVEDSDVDDTYPTTDNQSDAFDIEVSTDTSVKEDNIPIAKNRYLIITREMFTSTLKDFVDWKSSQGFEVQILTAEEIDQKYQEEGITKKIKNSIINNYSGNDALYVLLVGDTNLDVYVGGPEFYINDVKQKYYYNDILQNEWDIPTNISASPLDNFPYEFYNLSGSDLFYADIDYTDSNNDGFIELGDISFSSGLVAYVGRWPVRTLEELTTLIGKTKQMNSIGEATIIAAFAKPCSQADELDLSPGSLYLNCAPYHMFPSFPIGISTTYFENTYNLSEEDLNLRLAEIPAHFTFEQFSTYGDDREKIRAAINSAKGIVYELSHGTIRTISPGFTFFAKDFEFENSFPLLDTHSCEVSQFFVPDYVGNLNSGSFNESMIKNKKGPVVVLSSDYSKVFYEEIFKSKSVGKAYYFAHRSSAEPLLGDPSLIMYFTTPIDK